MEDANAQMAAMQAQFEETIAKLREDLTARLRVQEAANKSTRYSWYGGQRRDDGTDDGMVSRGGGMPRQQQQLKKHWSRDSGMPRQQQQQQQGLAVVACRGSSSNNSNGLAAVGFIISINVAPMFSLRPGRRDSSNRYSNRHGESLRSEVTRRTEVPPFLNFVSAVMAGLLRSGFSRAIWRSRCSPCRRDRSIRRRRQWHLVEQHLRLKR